MKKHNVSETGSVSVLRRGKTPTLLGPLERANLNHWIFIVFSLSVHKNKISNFINLSGHLKQQMNHRSTLEKLTLGNCAATQLWEDWLAQLPGSWLSQSSASCVAIALPFPKFALLHSVPHVQLSLITILGNCGCVAITSFLGVPSPWRSIKETRGA
jgi:hypothetical protein